MKNRSQQCEINREDFDSLFMWRVFWKLIRQETPIVYFLKVVSITAFFIILVLSICLIGTFAGN
jgi:hypothetical protein